MVIALMATLARLDQTDAIGSALAKLSLQHHQLALALAELQRQMSKLERHLQLEQLLTRHGGAPVQPPSSGSQDGEAPSTPMSRVLAFLDANLADDLSVDELARIAGLSPGHFSTMFRIAVGESPHRHLVRLRVERARALLLRGDSPADAALAVGFCDQSHLARHMQRLLGITPGALARAYRSA